MFLLKPHVTGAEGQVTSPDVIVDALIVDGRTRPLAMLTHNGWQQADADTTAAAGYALMALGGGALILPVLVLSDGLTVVARAAWRLATLDPHVDKVTLNGVALVEAGLPAAEIEAVGGAGDALPRGFLVVKTIAGNTAEAKLTDPILDRELCHRAHLEPLDADRWGGARPRPRYSVGPTQKDVPHYI